MWDWDLGLGVSLWLGQGLGLDPGQGPGLGLGLGLGPVLALGPEDVRILTLSPVSAVPRGKPEHEPVG